MMISLRLIRKNLLLFLALLVGMIYVFYWRFGYNADYAMIGLLAKRILETGEQFIFVPAVGYQGLLYEGNLVALMFRLFGVNPTVLNFAPFLTYLIFLHVFNRAVKAWNGEFVANIATLFVILSPPTFSRVVIRTQPNYGETFLMGSALFWIYRKILDELKLCPLDQSHPMSVAPGSILNPLRSRHKLLGLFALWGLVAGFGMYTYGQIAYFIGAILMHASFYLTFDFLQWRKASQAETKSSPLESKNRTSLASIKTYNRVFQGLFGYTLLGIILLATGFDQIHIGGHRIAWLPYGIVEFGIVGIIFTIWVAEFRRYSSLLRSHAASGLAMMTAFIVGYSPKLYYNFILKIPSKAGGLGRGGDLSELLMRAKFLFIGQLNLIGNPYSWTLTLLAAVLVLFFLMNYLVRVAKTPSISPFYFLIWMVIFSYISSTAVTDIHSARYTLVLFLSYGVAIGYTLEALINQPHRKILKSISTLAFASLLALNVQSLYENLKHADRPDVLEHIAKFLVKKNVHFGYGFYWYTYPINLLTQEDVILDPLGSNYTPFYREKVLAAPRIAYVDKYPYTLETFNNLKIPSKPPGTSPADSDKKITIFGNHYRVLEKEVFNSEEGQPNPIDVFILEKVDRTPN